MEPVWEAAHSRWTVSGLSAGGTVVVPSRFSHTIKILDCSGGRIVVTGKCKIALVDACRDTAVELRGGCVIAAEVANAARCTLTALGPAPTVQVDKSEACVVRFGTPRAARGSQVVSAACAGLVVEHPVAGPAGFARAAVAAPAGAPPGAQLRSAFAGPGRSDNDDDVAAGAEPDDEPPPAAAPALVTEVFVLYDRSVMRLGAEL